jgi:hypothetical protein
VKAEIAEDVNTLQSLDEDVSQHVYNGAFDVVEKYDTQLIHVQRSDCV